MLSPVVIPLPLALAFIALLAVALYAANRFLNIEPASPWTGQTWAAPAAPTGGRHRPENIANPVDWADIVSKRMQEQQRARVAVWLGPDAAETLWPVADDGAPLCLAGLPDREPIETGPLHIIGEDTRELVTVG
jgi:hypothetical protein